MWGVQGGGSRVCAVLADGCVDSVVRGSRVGLVGGAYGVPAEIGVVDVDSRVGVVGCGARVGFVVGADGVGGRGGGEAGRLLVGRLRAGVVRDRGCGLCAGGSASLCARGAGGVGGGCVVLCVVGCGGSARVLGVGGVRCVFVGCPVCFGVGCGVGAGVV